MKTYKLSRSATITETVELEAESLEAAIEAANTGEGEWSAGDSEGEPFHYFEEFDGDKMLREGEID